MCLLFAGGIRNPCSTSYINSTLQILLHFRPFTQLLSNDQHSKNYLVKVLNILYLKIKETQNNISADSIISYFQIDPKFPSTASKFLTLVYSNLPPSFHQIIFISELVKINCPTNINEICSNLQTSLNLNSYMMLILQLEINNEENQLIFLNADDQIIINNEKYYFYGFVQRRSTQYHFIMRDSEGWINCNDSSLLGISFLQAQNIFSDPRMPMELIILVQDIEMIEFYRKHPIFSNTRFDVNFNSAPSTQEDSQNNILEENPSNNDSCWQTNDIGQKYSIDDQENAYPDKKQNKKTLFSLKRDKIYDSYLFHIPKPHYNNDPSSLQSPLMKSTSGVLKQSNNSYLNSHNFNSDKVFKAYRNDSFITSSDSILKDDNHMTSSQSTQDGYDDDVIPLSNPEKNENTKYLICEYSDSKTNNIIEQFRIKIENKNYEAAAEIIKEQLETKYNGRFIYTFQDRFKRNGISSQSIENEAHAIFRMVEKKYDISIEIVANRTKQITREFNGNDTLSDIQKLIKLYCDIQNQNIYFYIDINKKVFKISNLNKKIKDLWKISKHRIKLIVFLNKQSDRDLYSIPIYQTDRYFRLVKYIKIHTSIDNTCRELLISSQNTFKEQLELVAFDNNIKQFITFPHDELLYKILLFYDADKLRLQKPIPEESVVILYDKPFTYVLNDNQSLIDLENEVKRYTGIQKDISLTYDQEVDNNIKPKTAWEKGLFNYMMILTAPKSLKGKT